MTIILIIIGMYKITRFSVRVPFSNIARQMDCGYCAEFFRLEI